MHIQVALIVEIDANASLSTMEQQSQEAGHQSMRDALKQAVRKFEQEHHVCAHCGSRQVRLEGTVSRSLQALFGAVCLARQRMRCQQCFRRFLPSAPLLSDLHRGRVSPALAEAAVLAGASWPYRQATQTLARLCGAQISARCDSSVDQLPGKQTSSTGRTGQSESHACRSDCARSRTATLSNFC